MEYIVFAIGVITCTISVIAFFINRKKEAIDDTKDNNKEKIDIAVFNNELKHLKDDVGEIKVDMKEIKQLFITSKDDMRDIAKEIVSNEMQKHIEKYHNGK